MNSEKQSIEETDLIEVDAQSSLSKNTFMLYLLTASNYLFGLVTVPYLTRVLGASGYGEIGFATAFSSYMRQIIDFGFILSATAAVAECNRSKAKVSEVMTAVAACKLMLSAVCTLVLILICLFIPRFSGTPLLFFGYLLYTVVGALIPDFVYRGLESMTTVTVRTVIIRAVFVVGVFLFVKRPSDFVLVPYFYLAGAVVAAAAVHIHMRYRLGIKYVRVSPAMVWNTFISSAQFFLSRVAGTLYSSLGTLVLGFVMPGAPVLGLYSACGNLITAGKMASSPLADSLYPYMVRTKDFKKLDRIALVAGLLLTAACLIAGIIAPWICLILFGDEYFKAGPLLRLMLPLVPLALLSYLYGFPALTPLGKSNVANASVAIGAVVQVFEIAILFILGEFNPYTLTIATVITETIVLAHRLSAYVGARRVLIKQGEAK